MSSSPVTLTIWYPFGAGAGGKLQLSWLLPALLPGRVLTTGGAASGLAISAVITVCITSPVWHCRVTLDTVQ